jgi:hypothetical protein
MTELPDDMEGVERRIQQDMDNDVVDVWRHCRIAFVNTADPDDVVGFPSFTKADLRALLLAYQERGRALERIFDLGSDGEHSGDRHARCREIARATLKGKSQ